MNIYSTILTRRSIRLYKNKKISRSTLDELIEVGRWAPSGNNSQPWFFIIIDDSKMIKKLKSISPGILCVPAFILIICSSYKGYNFNLAQREVLNLMAISMAAQNIILYAHSIGIGTCLIRSFHQKAIRKLLGCPEWIQPELLIIGGYPDQTVSAPSRKKLDEIRYFNKWEN